MAGEANGQGTMRYIRCPGCGMPNPGSATSCSRCGKPLPGEAKETPAPSRAPGGHSADQIICSKCRKALPAGSKFCGYCGASLPASQPAAAPPKPPKRAAAEPSPEPAKPKAPAPTSKAAAPPTAPTPRERPSHSPADRPSTPVAHAASTPLPHAGKPAAPSPEATQVFTGFREPQIDASMTEIKPDGSKGKTVRVIQETFIGRGNCDASYPDDVLLAPRHASIYKRGGKIILKDLGSQNGTFVKQRADTELVPGDVFLLGRKLFRFATQRLDVATGTASPQGTVVMAGAPQLQPGPITAKLEHIQLTGEVIEEFSLEKPETTIGRTTGDLVFKNDPYMSGTHARIVAQPGRFILQDMKSRNGVYRRIREESELRDGDEFFLGEQLFRVEIKVL